MIDSSARCLGLVPEPDRSLGLAAGRPQKSERVRRPPQCAVSVVARRAPGFERGLALGAVVRIAALRLAGREQEVT